uniref:Uncharacterized protein n=1 Tax=Arundo donax TaxID=35708 RepID=A0A0A9ELG5_ARUDO
MLNYINSSFLFCLLNLSVYHLGSLYVKLLYVQS